MHVTLEPVHTGAQVIARVVVAIDPQPVGLRAEPHAMEPGSPTVVKNEVSPPECVGLLRQGGVAVGPLGREAFGVDQQRLLVFRRAAKLLACFPGDPRMGACRFRIAKRLGIENLLQPATQDRQYGTPLLLTGRITVIQRQGQPFDPQGRVVGGRLPGHFVDKRSQPIVIHRVELIAEVGKQQLGIFFTQGLGDDLPIGVRLGRLDHGDRQIAVRLARRRADGVAKLVGHAQRVIARVAVGRFAVAGRDGH